MPFLYIRTCNSEIVARDEGCDYETNEAAMAQGVQSALGIVTDEILMGERSAAVDVCVEDQNGKTLLRTIVAVSTSLMMIDPLLDQSHAGVTAGPVSY